MNVGSVKPIVNVSVNFLQDQRSWIFYPTEILCYISSDNKNYQLISSQKIDAEKASEETAIKTHQFDLKNKNAQYVKIVAKKLGKLPKWHLGSPLNGRSWIFVDEISVQANSMRSPVETQSE